MRAIDGDALKERYENHRKLYCKNRIEFKLLSEKDKARVDELDSCIADVLNAPTIEPERKKGKWIRMSDADGDYYCCDQCGEELPRYMTVIPSWDRPYPHKQSIDKTNFCLNCGSDMREGDQDD